MSEHSKPLVWLHGEIKTPPLTKEARHEAGMLLRQLQEGMSIAMPLARPMPTVGPRCHELRIMDVNKSWRIIYRIESDAILILEVFQKTTNKTPKHVIDTCKRRLASYLATLNEAKKANELKSAKKSKKEK
jgi:phage-related protein